MFVGYQLEITFDSKNTLTKCPNGRNTFVHPTRCSGCNFYKGKVPFRNMIKCSYKGEKNVE